MGEFLGDKVPNVADRVEGMKRHQRALSVDGKSLAEIHPALSADVVIDSTDPNFGRIENPRTAAFMAHKMGREWDGTPSEIVNRDVDQQVASEIQAEVAAKEGEQAGRKAAQDYLITQGYGGQIEDRFMGIRQDIHTRTVNPVAALSDVVKSVRAFRNRKKTKV